MQRPERVAGVGEGRSRSVGKDIRRGPQQDTGTKALTALLITYLLFSGPRYHGFPAKDPVLAYIPVAPCLNTPLSQRLFRQGRIAYNSHKPLNPVVSFWVFDKYSAHNIPEISFAGQTHNVVDSIHRYYRYFDPSEITSLLF
jgi:hypothetical protein